MISADGMAFFRSEITRDFGYAESGYTFTPGIAAGPAWYRIAGDRPSLNAATVNMNFLAWRKNAEEWQANVYAGAGFGAVLSRGGERALGIGLLQADWENRRWHLMYQGQALANDRLFHLANTVHAGWAPWVAEYDEIAPWIYLRAFYVTGRGESRVDLAPVLVLMYKNWLVELGVDLDANPMFGLRYLLSF